MSNFPDFSELDYQLEQELGQNRAAGRVTYLAISTNTQSPVVLKHFQLAQLGASWSDYDAYQREIQVLQQLDHPSIPRYLDSFETKAGFCLVQEYKKASSLAQPQHWTPEEIKQIAFGVLEVLVYLQQQVPPVIHRDIKPENILVERQGEELKVTLVDFGFARMGGGEVAVSSVVKGTLGFMPPEQLFNRQLTAASDLYSLGVTLICLLTQTKSTAIGNLIDESYRINFKHLVPQLSPEFIDWLEKMVAPSLKHRYPNAATALKALLPIEVVRKGTTSGMVARATKLRIGFAAVGLATLSFVVIGTSFIFSSKMAFDPVRRLLETNQCPNCDLKSANLVSGNLSAADLQGANLKRANLGSAFLGSANLKGANLKGANLGSALLGSASLEGANLGNAFLESAYLGNAQLGGADLGSADLRSAYLRDANLTGANLEGADLTGAKLEGADLTGAKMPDGSIHP